LNWLESNTTPSANATPGHVDRDVVGVQDMVRQDEIIRIVAAQIGVDIAVAVGRLAHIGDHTGDDAEGDFGTAGEVQVAGNDHVVVCRERRRDDVIGECTRLVFAGGGFAGSSLEVGGDDMQVAVARNIDRDLDMIARSDKGIRPLVGYRDGPATDHAVGDGIAVRLRLDVEMVVRPENRVHKCARVGVGEFPLLDRHHIRPQPTEDALRGLRVPVGAIDQVGAAGEIGGHNGDHIVILDENRAGRRTADPHAARRDQAQADLLLPFADTVVDQREDQVGGGGPAGGEDDVGGVDGIIRATRRAEPASATCTVAADEEEMLTGTVIEPLVSVVV
jgi:hypothetical protein